jgi:hypothetical protein
MQQLELFVTDVKPANNINFNKILPNAQNKEQLEIKNIHEISFKQGINILTCRKNIIAYTHQQELALKKIAYFLTDTRASTYILAGYAGTGKTTIAENLVNYALSIDKECIITAPTNQAVKVLKDKFGDINVTFKTVHSLLYGSPDPETGKWIPSVTLHYQHVIFVDEASMLSKSVYTDLIREIKLNHAKIIFFGDSFQLEPVGEDLGILNNKNFELTEVKRQESNSEILLYATCLRNLKKIIIPNDSRGEVTILEKQSLIEYFLQTVINDEDSIFIVGTNKTRFLFNKKARQVKFHKDITDEPQNGDRILFIGNSINFVNGDKITLTQSIVITSKKLLIRESAKDYPIPVMAYLITNNDQKIIIIPSNEKSSIYHSQFIDANKQFPSEWCAKNLSNNKYELSKDVSIATYGYVITAHKSQGSQWKKVFVYQDAFKHNVRWLYTVVTRAEKELILMQELKFGKQQTWDVIIKNGHNAFFK